MGARAAVQSPPAKPVRKPRKALTEGEQHVIEDIIAQVPGGLTMRQQSALATVLRRPRNMVKQAVAEAALELADRAQRYADIHMKATEVALENGDAKSLEVAARASQWALENINVDGTRVVEKAPDKPTGPAIQIGIMVGGKNIPSESVIDVEKVNV